MASYGMEDGASAWSDVCQFKYVGARAPRRVAQMDPVSECPLVPSPIQIVRGLGRDERELLNAIKPPYLLVEFERTELPESRPLANLSTLL